MVFFNLFKKRKKAFESSIFKKTDNNKSRIEKLETEIKTIHLLVQNHDQSLTKHSRQLNTHTEKLESLVDHTQVNHPDAITNIKNDDNV